MWLSTLEHFSFPDFSFELELLLICEIIVQKTSERKSMLQLSQWQNLPFIVTSQSTEDMKGVTGKKKLKLSGK